MTRRLTDFSTLSFDCYGTLIDWESGIHAALLPLLARAGVERAAALELFARCESRQQAETPAMPYPEVLNAVYRRLAAAWRVAVVDDEAARFAASVPAWPAFADTVASLQYLKQHYTVVILSNVDRRSFAGSQQRLGIAFDAVYTAEDIGSYKPDLANFRFMLAQLADRGIAPGAILHTAQSLFHDHGPANAVGLATAWIDRRHGMAGGGATPPPTTPPQLDFRFDSLGAMAQAHQAAQANPTTTATQAAQARR